MTHSQHARGEIGRGSGHRAVRRVLGGIVSAIIVIATVLYLTGPTRLALAVTMQKTELAAKNQEVIHGWVHDTKNRPVDGARISIENRGRVIATWTTGVAGTYLIKVDLPKGRYWIAFLARINGQLVKADPWVLFIPGKSYEICAKATVHYIFSFLPISSY